jgi:spoIIIJ-associated protein
MPENVESVEVSGKTVEEAIAKALGELAVPREAAEVEVLSRGSRGVLGLGAEEARVRVSLLPTRGEAVPTEAPAKAPPAAEDVAKVARELLQELLNYMGVQARVVVIPGEPPQGMLEEEGPAPLMLDVRGNDLGVLIGRRGETLRALQYMTQLMLSRWQGRWLPVIVDVEQYKARRRHSLQQLARRVAEQVSFSHQPVALEAMPADERRIIHLALRNHPKVTTKSVGEGDRRKVTIIPRSQSAR